MTEIGTPGSTADNSINGGSKIGSAPKDKACPFCLQQFTSSSLGRHLDLYIKEKNAKPADGIHIVDEIRKLRGNITRRQPRLSTGGRDSTPGDSTPDVQERRSPGLESRRGDRSPSARREDAAPANRLHNGKPTMYIHKATWEATGVMNNIPAARVPSSRSWDGEEREGRRLEGRSRSVSKHILAKSTFDQKQKMIEALDSAKAAELALRELLGSVRAARQQVEGQPIFDYDPLTLDFPGLCLHCLPPPPTLHSSTPIPDSHSWGISPPDDSQYNSLRIHFSTAFRKHRNKIAFSLTPPHDDLSYPPPPDSHLQDENMVVKAAEAEAQATELEKKIFSHLRDVFSFWKNIPAHKRSEIWTLEFARSVGRKAVEIEKVKKEKDYLEQTNTHLKQQNYELSRLQQPREFRVAPPQTIPISQDIISHMLELGVNPPPGTRSIGYMRGDHEVHLDTLTERVLSRWKGVVKETRDGTRSGMPIQRNFSGDSLLSPDSAHMTANSNSNSNSNSNPLSPNPIQTPVLESSNGNIMNTQQLVPNGLDNSMGSDPDADADADMEEDDSYSDMNNLRSHHSLMPAEGQTFRLANGNNMSGSKAGGGRNNNNLNNTGMEGIENVQGGYVRIGA